MGKLSLLGEPVVLDGLQPRKGTQTSMAARKKQRATVLRGEGRISGLRKSRSHNCHFS